MAAQQKTQDFDPLNGDLTKDGQSRRKADEQAGRLQYDWTLVLARIGPRPRATARFDDLF